MVQMKLYEKIVRLNVDIKDLCHYLRRLNYLWKLEKRPDYYDDSSEEHTPGLRG